MAFVPEDGTGLQDANSLVTLDYFREYCTDYGYTVQASWDDPRTQVALLKATSFFDSMYSARFPGQPRSPNQALCWPRSFAYRRVGAEGTTILLDESTVPAPIANAVCELALIADTADLSPNISPDNLNVVFRKVGPIETRFNAKTVSAVTIYRKSAMLVNSFLASSGNNITLLRS